jgi:hypothetical protein
VCVLLCWLQAYSQDYLFAVLLQHHELFSCYAL